MQVQGFKASVRSRVLHLTGQDLLSCASLGTGSALPTLSTSINTSLADLNPGMDAGGSGRAADVLAELIASGEFFDGTDARVGRQKIIETNKPHVTRAKRR